MCNALPCLHPNSSFAGMKISFVPSSCDQHRLLILGGTVPATLQWLGGIFVLQPHLSLYYHKGCLAPLLKEHLPCVAQ